ELSRFAVGVRILILSDSCHSGTVARAAEPRPTAPNARSKMMPLAVGLRTYREHQAFYDKLQRDVTNAAGKASIADPDSALAQVAVSPRLTAIVKKFNPGVILISGCQDNQTSLDGEHNGAFTEQLLRVWNQGAFRGNYAKFHAAIKAGLPASQTPNLFTLGAVARFLRQEPFSV
ncbi:MAG: caspase family protein, partial [Nitrospira sp.]|nr:caspase family protein [Nitrospira sp.]